MSAVLPSLAALIICPLRSSDMASAAAEPPRVRSASGLAMNGASGHREAGGQRTGLPLNDAKTARRKSSQQARVTPAIPSQAHAIRPPAAARPAGPSPSASRAAPSPPWRASRIWACRRPTRRRSPWSRASRRGKPQLPELEPVVTSLKLAALASMSGLREPRVDLPACSRSSLSKPDDGRGGGCCGGGGGGARKPAAPRLPPRQWRRPPLPRSPLLLRCGCATLLLRCGGGADGS